MAKQFTLGENNKSDMKFTVFTAEEKLYQSRVAAQRVIGCLMQKPSLLKTHRLRIFDFAESFQQFIYVPIQTLIRNGAHKITPEDVENMLRENYPDDGYLVFKKFNGLHYLTNALEMSDVESFEAYYIELLKWSALRGYLKRGFNVKEFYDPSFNPGEDSKIDKIKQDEQIDRFNNSSLEELTNFFKGQWWDVTKYYSVDTNQEVVKAGGKEAKEVFANYKKGVNVGLDYNCQYLTTANYGLRKGRLSIFSAPSGVGKTRVAMSNMCHTFCPIYWDSKANEWVENTNGKYLSALFITTEMDPRTELESILQAYMAEVPEDHIRSTNKLTKEEEERVLYAIDHVRRYDNKDMENIYGIYFKSMPQYTVASLRNTIEYYHDNYGVDYIFLDYIHSNPFLIQEYHTLSGIKDPREDQVLLNLTTALKDMCIDFNVAIEAATQISGDWKNGDRDANLVRGAKSIVDKADTCIIYTPVTTKEKNQLQKLMLDYSDIVKNENRGFNDNDDYGIYCYNLYKNRGGRYNNIKIWVAVNYGTMRMHDLFVTDVDITKIIPVEKTRIVVKENGERMAFTRSDAKAAWKNGEITLEEYQEIEKKVLEDPQFLPRNKAAKTALREAENAVNDVDPERAYARAVKAMDEDQEELGIDW